MKGTITMNSQQNSSSNPSRLVFRASEEWDTVPTGNRVFLNTNQSTQDPLVFNNTLDDYDR